MVPPRHRSATIYVAHLETSYRTRHPLPVRGPVIAHAKERPLLFSAREIVHLHSHGSEEQLTRSSYSSILCRRPDITPTSSSPTPGNAPLWRKLDFLLLSKNLGN